MYNRQLLKFINTFKPSDEQAQLIATAQFSVRDIQWIQDVLDDLLVCYPEDQMEELYETYLEWDDTVRLALEYNLNEVIPLIDGFWEIFCGLLRTKYNENILDPVVEAWKVKFFSQDFPAYRQHLKQVRRELLQYLEKIPSSGKDTAITERIMDLARSVAIEERSRNGAR